jgi:hypothetical protein
MKHSSEKGRCCTCGVFPTAMFGKFTREMRRITQDARRKMQHPISVQSLWCLRVKVLPIHTQLSFILTMSPVDPHANARKEVFL